MNDIDERYLGIIEKINSLNEGDEIPADLFANLSQREIIAIYVEQMLIEKGVDGVTNEMRIKLIDELNGRISENVVNALPEDVLAKYGEGINSMTDDELEKIITEAGVDVSSIAEKTMNDFREQFLNGGEQ